MADEFGRYSPITSTPVLTAEEIARENLRRVVAKKKQEEELKNREQRLRVDAVQQAKDRQIVDEQARRRPAPLQRRDDGEWRRQSTAPPHPTTVTVDGTEVPLDQAVSDIPRQMELERLIASGRIRERALRRARTEELIDQGKSPAEAESIASKEQSDRRAAFERGKVRSQSFDGKGASGFVLKEGVGVAQDFVQSAYGPLARAAGFPQEADQSEAFRAGMQSELGDWRYEKSPYPEFQENVSGAANSAAQMMPGIVASTVAGPGVGLGIMSAQFGAQAYNEGAYDAAEAGLTGASADKYAKTQAAIAASITPLFSKIPGMAGIEGRVLRQNFARSIMAHPAIRGAIASGTKLTKDTIAEAVEESTEGVLSGAAREKMLNQKVDYKKIVVDSTVQSLFTMGLFAGSQKAGDLISKSEASSGSPPPQPTPVSPSETAPSTSQELKKKPEVQAFIAKPSAPNYEAAVKAGMPPIENPNRGGRNALAKELQKTPEPQAAPAAPATPAPQTPVAQTPPATPAAEPQLPEAPSSTGLDSEVDFVSRMLQGIQDENVQQETSQQQGEQQQVQQDEGQVRQEVLNPAAPQEQSPPEGSQQPPAVKTREEFEAEYRDGLQKLEQSPRGTPEHKQIMFQMADLYNSNPDWADEIEASIPDRVQPRPTLPVDSPEPQAVQTPDDRKAWDSEREPWQMGYRELREAVTPATKSELEQSRSLLSKLFPTDDEHVTANESDDPWGIYRAITRGDETPRTPTADLSLRHRKSIIQALSEGKKVPDEVLAEYPDLKSQTPPVRPPGEALPDQQTSPSTAGPVLEQPENQVPDAEPEPAPAPTTPAPSLKFLALPQKSQDTFNAAFESRDPEALKQIIGKSNAAWNAEFTNRTGIKLPRATKEKQRVVQEWAASRTGQTAPEVQQTPINANEEVAPAPETPAAPPVAETPDAPTADLPWRNSSIEDESKWYGTGITVAPSNRREVAYKGTVVRVLNKGDMVEVQPDGQDGTFRVASDRITINETPEQAAQPEPVKPESLAADVWPSKFPGFDGVSTTIGSNSKTGQKETRATIRFKDSLNTERSKELDAYMADRGYVRDSSSSGNKSFVYVERKEQKPVAEQPAIPAFTRTTPDKTSITRQDRADRIKEVQQKIREVETRLKARQNEYDGLRSNATNKRAAAKRDIANLQERIRDLQTSIRRDETQSRLAELEDALESPRSYDHYLAGMAAVNKISVDYEPDDKREARAKKFGDELFARAVDEGKSQGLDESDAKQAASSAVNGFSADDDRPLAYFVERAADRIREARIAMPMGKLFPNKAVYGLQKTILSNEQRDQFAEQLREASKDDKGYAKKISEINKQIDKTVQDIKDKAAAEEKKKAELAAQVKAEEEKQQLANARSRAKKYFLEKRIENALKGRKIETKTVYVRQEKKGDPVKLVEGARTEADKKGELYPSGLVLHPSFAEDSKDFALTHARSGTSFPAVSSKTEMKTLAAMVDALGMDFNVDVDSDGKLPQDLLTRTKSVNTAWERTDYSALSDQDRATVEALATVPPTDIQADLILTADDIGANGIPKGLDSVMTDRGVKVVKDLTNEVAEFAYDPVFTVQGGKLVFRDGYVFKFEPKVFNLHPSELKEGQTVGINLEDMGIKRATPQDVVVDILKKSLPKVTKGKSGDSVTAGYIGSTVSIVKGQNDNDWSVVSGPQKVKDIVVKALEKIRWRQPGQTGEAKTDIGNAKPDPSPARQAADKAKEELAALDAENQKQIDIIKKEWGKITKGEAQPSGFIPVTKEMGDAIAKLMLGKIRSGAKRFDVFVKELRANLGDDNILQGIKPTLINAWNAFQKTYGVDPATEQQFNDGMKDQAEPLIESPKPPTEPPTEPTFTDSGKNLYSTQNASTDVDRAELGMPVRPTREQASREAQTAMAAALSKTDAGRKQTDDVIREVMVRPRALTVIENDLLGVRRVELKQKLKDALAKKVEAMKAGDDAQTVIWQTAVAEHNAKLQEIIRILSEDASYLVGTQLQARKAWIDDEYSYERMTMEYAAAYGKEPEGEALAEIERKVLELEESQAAQQKLIDEQNAEINDLKKRLEEAHNERVEEVSPKPRAAKKKVSKESESARAKVNETWKANMQRLGKFYSIGKAVSDSYQAFFELAGAYAELGVVTLGDFMGRIKKRMGPDAEPFANDITEAWKDYQSQNTSEFVKRITDKIDLEDAETIGKAARDLHRLVIQRDGLDGSAAGRDAAVKAVHELLVQVVPDITLDQTARAMSGIGIYSELSKEEVEVILRDQRAQLRLVEQAKDWNKAAEDERREPGSGKVPPPTGREHEMMSDEQRELKRVVEVAKRAAGISSNAPGLLRSSLDAAKRNAINRIADLDKAIKNNERIIRSKNIIEDPTGELDKLKEQRDALQKQYNEIFGKNELSDEQKIARTEKMLDRALADMESELKAGKLYPDSPKPKLTSPAIEAKRSALEAMKALRAEMRISTGEAQARSDAAYERHQLETIAKLEKRLAEKDYKPADKKPERVQTREMLRNGLKIKKLRDQLAKDIKQWQFNNLHPLHKLWIVGPKAGKEILRMTMLAFEMSPIGRQGRLLGGSHPKIYFKAISKAFASNFWEAKSIFATEQDLFNTMAELDADTDMVRMEKIGKLEITDVNDGGNSEEGFQAVPNWVHRLWGLAGSERAAVAFLNTQRRLVFRALVQDLAKKYEAEGRSISNAELRVIGNACNVPSGRANLGQWMMALKAFSEVFLAPRWNVSRAYWWIGEPIWHEAKWRGGEGASSDVRKMVAVEWVKQGIAQLTFIGFVVGTLYAMLGPPGDDEEWDFYWDPRHKYFGQLRVGDRYTDLTAGLAQYLSMGVRLFPGAVEKRRWETVEPDRGQIVGRYIQGKLAPVPSILADYIFGPMTPGVEFGSKEWAAGKFTPLYGQEVRQAFDGAEKPSEKLLGLMWSTLAFFGQSSRSQEARIKERKTVINEIRAYRNQGKREKVYETLNNHLKHAAQMEAKEALRVVPPDADPKDVEKLNKIAAGTDSPELTEAIQKERFDIVQRAAEQLSSEDRTKQKKPNDDQSIRTARDLLKEIAPSYNEAKTLFEKAYKADYGSVTELVGEKGRKRFQTRDSVIDARRRLKAMYGVTSSGSSSRP